MAQFKIQLVLYDMILTINLICQSKKKILIEEVYCIIDIYNNNVCYLKIIIEFWIYIVEYIYLNNLNFYHDIADLYTSFGMDFVFLITEKYSYH